ncbi:MAG TPA: carbohydrate porin [Bryobacteraceae bacterium]|nr:carbohydrate porin [Bryobacteraceae bacterium]
MSSRIGIAGILSFFLFSATAFCEQAPDTSTPATSEVPQNTEASQNKDAQTPSDAPQKIRDLIADRARPDPERWNIFYQATSIGDYHGAFPAKYSGPLSLVNHSERDVSLTTTLFLGLRVAKDTQLYFDPEIAGGRGFSGVDGLANSPNGELPRVASATPKPYIARAYVMQDFGFGDERESFTSDENQLAGSRPTTRYTVIAGRFTVTDFFDNNAYSHDPRTQFMGWAVMYNGAWDYPADTRGYTWGWVHEFHTKRWSARYGSAAEPKTANGLRFDRRLFRDRGDMLEGELRYAPGGHAGALRVLGSWLHTDSGSYAEALALSARTGTRPDVTATRQPGRLKYGVGINMEQEVSKGIGVFARLGWSDGKTESFAFTAMDRLATGGVSVKGDRWKRPEDVAATELTVGGISGVHASYLAHGGNDFLIGDGALTYAPEYIWESYYSARVFKGFFTTLDAQRVNNPAYNQARGPLWILSLRLHLELGKDNFERKH